MQLHPVVSRLCAPIEGTDAPRLAACLGLDPSRFRGGPGTAAAAGGGGDEDAREDALLAPGSSLDDPSRYQVCLAVSLSMACLCVHPRATPLACMHVLHACPVHSAACSPGKHPHIHGLMASH